MLSRLKVLVVGPCKVGKTTIVNYVTEAIDNPETDYHPTQGVRIIEYESVNPFNSNHKAEVELWDCSGDAKFDACWPALQQGVHGVMLMVDPASSDHIQMCEKFLGLLSNISTDQLLVLLCSHGTGSYKLPGAWSHARQAAVDFREGGAALRREIATFVSHLNEAARAHTDREELNFLGLR